MSARIRIYDLETTGFAPPHAPCEIGFVDLVAEGFDLTGSPCNWKVEGGTALLCHPGRAIPPESSAVHHITDEDVADACSWRDAARLVRFNRADTSDIIASAAHNAQFERQWLTPIEVGDAPWICTYKCALRLWPDAPGHSNQTLRYWRRPEGLDRSEAPESHRAYADAYVTAFLLRDMLELTTVEQLIEWTAKPALLAKIPFGQHKGDLWREADFGFLKWVLSRDFSDDIMFTAATEMTRRFEAQGVAA